MPAVSVHGINSTLLTIPEFASLLRIRPSCVRRWIHEERITTVRVGRLVRIPMSEVERVISLGTRPATASRSKSFPSKCD
jgi:excisionase family DNA binding protein